MITRAAYVEEISQEVGTPPEFLDAVQRRFGTIGIDLAANAGNTVHGILWHGPGSLLTEDALSSDTPWPEFKSMVAWLNPPYDNIKAFARRCRLEAARGCRIVMLIPASVATNWFAEEIYGHALVLPVRPRLTFVGHKDPYPKDLMLCCYNLGPPGFEPWRWR